MSIRLLRGIQHSGVQHVVLFRPVSPRDYDAEQHLRVLRKTAVDNVERWQPFVEAIDQELAKRGVTSAIPDASEGALLAFA